MFNRNNKRSLAWPTPNTSVQTSVHVTKTAPSKSVVNRAIVSSIATSSNMHPLSNKFENEMLFNYEKGIKESFDAIIPTLKQLSALQYTANFEEKAQELALKQLGFNIPTEILADAWVEKLDMRRLFAWCLFETYKRFCDDFFINTPIASDKQKDEFQIFLQDCGFHTLDVSPCADGRLAHVIRYVLRLPYRAVRRKSYAGAMFDVEDSIQKWVKVEMLRFREANPNRADMPTKYLKSVVYHYSSVDSATQGCAAHGSDTALAAQEGLNKLYAFQEAIQNSFSGNASIDILLIGLDTATDEICVHVPDAQGKIDLNRCIDAGKVYKETIAMHEVEATEYIHNKVCSLTNNVAAGMARFITKLIINNISQIDYVNNFYGNHYEDIGHAERFIGAGIGFEEIQLRNLTYFSYLDTVEEATPHLDVGIKIFTQLNLAHGLPVPIVVRYDYHGQVPGARKRAIEHCQRVTTALNSRYAKLVETGMLHTLQVIRDCNANSPIEILTSSVKETLNN